ncbi:unnamed protein product [Durusdinium trenchii]|uniref:Uncharacterized protein n=1 Tax=Durusdinium trenchii TaxID=1381693 RepID=A0ABP0N4S8_9DINO
MLKLRSAAVVQWLGLTAASHARLTEEPDAVPPAVPVAPYVRVIHQQYRTAHADAWPPEWRRLSGFWQRAAAHGRWRWRFWTDEEEAKLFKEELPELEEFYHWIPQCLDAKISQADLSTYAILYVHGGVYADMDTMPVGSLDAFLDAVSSDATGERPLAVLASISRPDEEDIRGRGGFLEPYGVDTDLMISTAPRHPFFLEALLSIRRYLQTHNATVCGRDRRTPTYDLMFLTAWGRLSMLARAWTAEGLNQSRLTFLESLFLREPYEASHVHLVLHVLANLSLEELVAHPPPRHELRLERWLAKRLERSTKRSRPHGHATDLSPPILRVAPDLLLAPIAQSPAVEKRQLRQWHLTCKESSSCFEQHVLSLAQKQIPERDPKHNLVLIFNDDDGVWEGSWNEANQEAFRRLETAKDVELRGRRSVAPFVAPFRRALWSDYYVPRIAATNAAEGAGRSRLGTLVLVWGLDEEFGQEQLDLLSTLVRNEGGGLGDAVEDTEGRPSRHRFGHPNRPEGSDELRRAETFDAPGARRRFARGAQWDRSGGAGGRCGSAVWMRAALRAILAERLGVEPQELQFQYGPHGKPELATPWARKQLSFSVSHSGQVWVFESFLGLAETMCSVGVDLEERRPRPFLRLAKRFFTAEEVSALRRVEAARWHRSGGSVAEDAGEWLIRSTLKGTPLPNHSVSVSMPKGVPLKLDHLSQVDAQVFPELSCVGYGSLVQRQRRSIPKRPMFGATDVGAIKDAQGLLQLSDYDDLKALILDEAELADGREGLLAQEELPDGVRRWKDEKGAGWVARHPNGKGTRWFNKTVWKSWRMAFLLARLQRDLWGIVDGQACGSPDPAEEVKEKEVERRKRGRPPKSPGTPGTPRASAAGSSSRGRGRGRGLKRPATEAQKPKKAPKTAPKKTPKARSPSRTAPTPAAPTPAAPAPAVPPVPRGREEKLLGGRHRALALFNLRTEWGREALAGLLKDGFAVLHGVFTPAECDLAVDKIWDFATGRCPNLDPKEETTWSSENWSQVARGKNLCQLHGAGWVLWEERLRFRERLVERGIYADVPHHASWDGFHFGRPSQRLWGKSHWDHTDQVLLNGESTGCTWIQGLVQLNDMDPAEGPAFECWPGSQQDDIFVPLQKTAGLCEATPSGSSFRLLTDAGRGWLQGKGLQRQRVTVGPGDVILWDSRLVHQGGAPASADGSRAKSAGGRRVRGCFGRMVQYVCLGLAEFTSPSVLQKRRKCFESGGDAVTLNHKPDSFEPFRKSRHHPNSPPLPFPVTLPPSARQLHGLGEPV